jgi:hypothetical protein
MGLGIVDYLESFVDLKADVYINFIIKKTFIALKIKI